MNFKNKNLSLVISVLLLLSFVVSMFASAGSANAQTGRKIATFPFVEIVPSTLGVGQTGLINFGLLNPIGVAGDGWNVTLTIVDPDNNIETSKHMTWSTGMVGISYTPEKEGDYMVSMTFDETVFSGNTYLASKTGNSVLHAINGYTKPSYPGHYLPSEYWTRPVDSQLREWWSIMGSWLISKSKYLNMDAPYNDAPKSAHVLWSVPDGQYDGGLSGGISDAFNGIGFQHGDAYEGKFYGAIIVAGVLYYNVAPMYGVTANNGLHQTIRAIDLHTGKILWEKNLVDAGFSTTTRLSLGQVMLFFSENNRGTWSYLWLRNGQTGTTWYALNPMTGEHIYTYENVPSGNVYFGQSGEILIYPVVADGMGGYVLRQWNSTSVIYKSSINLPLAGQTTNQASGPRVFNTNGTVASQSGYDWNISLPRNLGNPIRVFPGDRAIFSNTSTAGISLSAVSLSNKNFGSMLYTDVYWQAPSDWATLTAVTDGSSSSQTGWAAFSDNPYVAVYWTKENRVNYAFSLETGAYLWESKPQNALDGLGGARPNSAPERVIAYGKLIEGSVGGIVYCYDAKSGEELWTYEAVDPYIGESYLTERWWLTLCFVSDNMVFFGHHEHSANVPLPRGAPFFALDVETGDVVWRINGAFRQPAWGGRAIIGDSIIVTLDTYDSQVYAIGKGPTESTVSVSNAVTAAGSTVLITGTVMDISPGVEQDNVKYRFSKGVPAVSDESMSEWMLHVYKQFEQPTNVTGISVLIATQDENGNWMEIGSTTTDVTGSFTMAYTPDRVGDYTIHVFSDDTAAYYSSEATTSIKVLEAPESPESPPYGWYIAGAVLVIIIAVALVGLLIYRKK